MKVFSELRRRNVFRMALLYLGAAWLILQVVDLLIDRGPLAESLGPLTLTMLAIGLPIALVLSWFYEVTPEGISRDEGEGSVAAASAVGRRLDFVVIAVLAAAVVMFAWDKWGTGAPPERSVAVLPFVSLNTDEDTAYLGTGIADTILNMLAQMPELHVASATSSFQTRLGELSVQEIAGLLGVATLLEGSVQRHGNQLRITAQLIDAETNAHLWSSNFTRDDAGIFKIQDEIAVAVASAMHIVMRDDVRQRIDRAGTDNLAAFEAYSKAIDNLRVITTESFEQAFEQLQQAVELDPSFARALSLLGHTYLEEYCCGRLELTLTERVDLARTAAKDALRIAPGLSTALTLLARVTDDSDTRGELYREAVANDPNDTLALRYYARYLYRTYQTDEAMNLAEKLLRMDPLYEDHYILLARMQLQQSMPRTALETLARGKDKIPQSVALRDYEYQCYEALGNRSSMIRVKHETLAIDPEEWVNRWYIAQNYFVVGLPEEAVRWWERAIETAPQWERDYLRLMLHTSLDIYHQRDDERVFESLRSWVAERRGFGYFSRVPAYFFTEYGDRLGRLDEVLSTYESHFPELFQGQLGARDMVPASFVGEALLRAGDRERGEPMLSPVLELLTQSIAGGRDFQDHVGYIDTHLALGDTDTALNQFRKLNSIGRFWHGGLGQRFIMQNNPAWAPIRATPEYAALLDELDLNAAEHREMLQAMDLPLK